ncbi:MAG TPA: hypothetical protein VK657_08850, partial [Terriglobales bacterium]|nr:hypothetical protein [Terriglobales bacterium]
MQRLLDIANAMRPVLTHAQADATRQLRNAAEAQGRTMQTQARATIDLASATAEAAEAAQTTAEAMRPQENCPSRP